MNSDCGSDVCSASNATLDVPELDLIAQREGASNGPLRSVILLLQSAERGHEPVAKVLVEGALVSQHDPRAPPPEILQQREGAVGRKALRQSREPDNISKEHRDMTRRRIAEARGHLVGQGNCHVR